MTIRRLTASDGFSYQQLRLLALQTDPAAFLANFPTESEKTTADFARELELALSWPIYGYYGLFESPTTSITQEESSDKTAQLLAFVQLGSAYFSKQFHLAFLYNLYVMPNARKQGLANQLFHHVKNEIQQLSQIEHPRIERLYADVVASNQTAQTLYRKLGFTQCGWRQDAVKTETGYDSIVELELVL